MYADIIIDISHSKLDQTFQYRIPPELAGMLEPGDVVELPFGNSNRLVKGYVLRVSRELSCPPEKLKTIARRVNESRGTESKLISLALWMRDYYGSTTIQALRTVLPFRNTVPEKKKKRVVLAADLQTAGEALEMFRKKHQTARARLLEALLEEPVLPQEVVTGTLRITKPVLQSLEEKGLIRCETEQVYRTPAILQKLRSEAESRPEIIAAEAVETPVTGFALSEEQQAAVDAVSHSMGQGFSEFLLHGVTGSGKTAVYMELIARALRRGKQAILLIPEISLTYQNVVRFYHAFGDRISILHSRLTQAERYDQFERAKMGDIDVMIGPRSALFTPFEHLGLIIIDEEHEPSYKSESTPRYDARETARKRAELEKAVLVLGSATPSLESYYAAEQGMSTLLSMQNRPTGGSLAKVTVVDMRNELRDGNSSIMSRALTEKLRDTLARGEQSMLFLNRRGYAGFVLCRSCGHVMKCPHCDVSLSLHEGGRLVCHYCGYERPALHKCPKCGSPFIGGFKAGTQQIEAVVAELFPKARILRMDADTTRGKDGHAEILRAFGHHEADILVGTQMIVKGHDFPGVALVGALAADMSLNVSDFRAAERTYQLLVQAAGRAGRGEIPGEVVIQTYQPDHYAITCSASQSYEPFYEQEIDYRTLSGYPPTGSMMTVHCAAADEEQLKQAAAYLARFASHVASKYQAAVMGPSREPVSKIKDIYRMAIYIRHKDAGVLTAVKNYMEQYIGMNSGFSDILINFER
ncbi:MAG: primosomal protein N' [Lachnospiraceae bacterium]|nr:primosomal protein N' [Lachnospiraceae bacterium]